MRNKQFNTKKSIIIGVVLFIVISFVVINAKDMKTISRVKVSNQKIVINQESRDINNTEIGFNNRGSLNNQNINGGNTGNLSVADGHLNNTGSFKNQDAGFGNRGEFNNTGGSFSNQDGGIHNAGNFNNSDVGFGNNGSEFGNNGFNGKNVGGNGGNYNVGFGNQDYRSDANKYKYQAIDWGTWKSNFVNRILDDSMYITSLDSYGLGTWFYYSFKVTDAGEIKDVTVFSFYLKDYDQKQIRKLIRSYAHQPITIFPKDSKRKIAKVKAVMLLGDTETKSNASNFRDIEKIKIQY